MSTISDLAMAGQYNYLTSNFGWRTYKYVDRWVTDYHEGCDYGTVGKALALYPIEDNAWVYSVGYHASAGYYIWIKYERLGVRIAYFHMKAASPLKAGAKVRPGTLCGYVGNTGSSTAVHLHIGIIKNGAFVDPEAYSKTYKPSSGGSTGGSGVPYLAVMSAFTDNVSSKQLSEGAIGVKMPDGRVYGYNPNGDARIKKEYTEFTLSQVRDQLVNKELRAGEMIIKTD